jgi:hypothetical protein
VGCACRAPRTITVTDFSATDQRIRVFTHVGSSGIVLDRVRTTGGSRGLVTEKSTSDLEARNSTFTAARVASAALDGTDITVRGVQVRDARSGIRVERVAHDVRLTDVTVTGGGTAWSPPPRPPGSW